MWIIIINYFVSEKYAAVQKCISIFSEFSSDQSFDPLIAENWHSYSPEFLLQHCKVKYKYKYKMNKTEVMNLIIYLLFTIEFKTFGG